MGSPSELPLQASKWLQIQMLVDAVEMAHLFESLGVFQIFTAGVVCLEPEGEISKKQFLEIYGRYVETLKNGQLPDENLYRQVFSSIFTIDTRPLFQIALAEKRKVIRVALPVLQLQLHKMACSAEDGKFRPMVLGKDCLFWGLQFSYPQLYQDDNKDVHKALDESLFPNALLYRHLQKWVRLQTIPTPFLVNSRQINVPMRLGKNCLAWINHHPQLKEQNLNVILPSKFE